MQRQEQIDKIGNAIIYLTKKMGPTSKTKILKLLYKLDEISIKDSGIPFFNLDYKAWRFGPVEPNIYIDLSDGPNILSNYIKIEDKDCMKLISPIKDFDDFEFSDYNIDLMDKFIRRYKDKRAEDLVNLTHEKGSPWWKTAKENNVLVQLLNGEINSTDFKIDLSRLVNKDARKKSIYENYTELF